MVISSTSMFNIESSTFFPHSVLVYVVTLLGRRVRRILMDCFTFDDGTNILSQNIGNSLTSYAA
jgi:hypothetical protein